MKETMDMKRASGAVTYKGETFLLLAQPFVNGNDSQPPAYQAEAIRAGICCHLGCAWHKGGNPEGKNLLRLHASDGCTGYPILPLRRGAEEYLLKEARGHEMVEERCRAEQQGYAANPCKVRQQPVLALDCGPAAVSKFRRLGRFCRSRSVEIKFCSDAAGKPSLASGQCHQFLRRTAEKGKGEIKEGHHEASHLSQQRGLGVSGTRRIASWHRFCHPCQGEPLQAVHPQSCPRGCERVGAMRRTVPLD